MLKSKTKSASVFCRLSTDLLKEIEDLSEKETRTVSNMIRVLVSESLKQRKQKE